MAKLILTVGIPGSGKSYWAEAYAKEHGFMNINRDDLRIDLFLEGDATRYSEYQFTKSKEARVTSEAIGLADSAEIFEQSIIISDTNLNAFARKFWKDWAEDYGYEYEEKFFDTPIELCLERNAKRVCPVPEFALHTMQKKAMEYKRDLPRT